jgi:hypothetical protein
LTETTPAFEPDELPEQTDNSIRDEDGVQDVDQSPTPTPGSPT